MSLILAIEPDRRQASQIAALVRSILHAELVLADSADRGLRGLGQRLPDLILTSALLSPGDEASLADRLREFDAASSHVQTLTIPVLAASSGEAMSNGGVLGRLRRRVQLRSAPDGCDPAVFAQQITEYLERSAADRRRQSAVDSRPPSGDGHASTVPVQPKDDCWTTVPATLDGEDSLELATDDSRVAIDESPRATGDSRLPASDCRRSTDDSQLTANDVLRALGLTVVCDPVLTEEVVAADEPRGEAVDEEIDLTSELDELEEHRTESSQSEIAVAAEDGDGSVSAPLRLEDSWRELRAQDLAGAEVDLDPKGPLCSPVLAAEWGQSELLDFDFWEFREPDVDEEEELRTPLPRNVHLVWPAPQGIILEDAPPPEWADWATPTDADSETNATAAPTSPEVPPTRPAPATAPAASLLGTRAERTRPATDEWGLFDPAQCGFEALLVKLDELTEEGR
jgi:hypothetical protein